ncbi:MAG TPA: O-antigen ligase family protein, partial [Rhizobiaceae bacterium]|nr:O-antigen ligase family protein [Rhizobiaceae bacterium]
MAAVQARQTQLEDTLARFIDALPFIIAAGLFSALMISFTPFQAGSESASETASNSANLLGFSALGAISIAALLGICDMKRLSFLFDPLGFVVIGLLFWSARNTPDPSASTRAVLFTLTAALVAATVILLPRSPEEFARVSLVAISAALGLSWLGVFIFPNEAIHSGASLEPQHAGLWRGHFIHKNMAGPMMTIFFFYGVYFWRFGYRWQGALVALFSFIFVLKTGSKTTLGFLPVAAGAVLLYRLFGSRALTIVVSLLFLAFATALSLGSLYAKPLSDLAQTLTGDATFTGRTQL